MWRIAISSIFLFFSIIVGFSPNLALADGLVPCGGVGEEPCQACHVIQLTSNVFNWAGVVLGIIFVIVVVLAGIFIMSSGGAAGAKTKARKIIANLIVGYILFLAAWFVVDLFLKLIATNDQTYGMWNEVQCVEQPTLQMWSRVPASQYDPDTGVSTPLGEYNSGQVTSAVNAIQNSSVSGVAKNTALNAGMTEEQARTFQGLVNQESGNCTNKVGPSTSYGTAYGCTQMLVSTARQMDPNLRDLTDSQIADKLRDDDEYSLQIGAKYYKSLLDKYDGNIDKSLAAYNGGPGANAPSRDCPGIAKWQCEWDSPGCYETGKTNCKRNEGFNSYEQTRNYVSNIKQTAERLGG